MGVRDVFPALSVEIELGSTRPVVALEAWSLAPVRSSLVCGVALEVKIFRRRAKRENTFDCLIKREVLLSVRTAIWETPTHDYGLFLQKSREFVPKDLHDVGIQ